MIFGVIILQTVARGGGGGGVVLCYFLTYVGAGIFLFQNFEFQFFFWFSDK